MTAYWQEHQVGGPYASLEESEAALVEREQLFPALYELMPVDYPGQIVLDYGCGPGHDTILFLKNGAKFVYYVDASSLALRMTTERLAMHDLGQNAKGLPAWMALPLVDHIHCAGVIHHTEDPLAELKKLRGALREGGEARIMVYNGATSRHSQSNVPITRWWTPLEFIDLCQEAGWEKRGIDYMGSYACSAPWRSECYAACFRLR